MQDCIAQTLAPLTDSNARLNYLAIVVIVLLVAPSRGPSRQIDALISALETVEAFAYALLLFFGLNAVLSVFRVLRAERELGIWVGARFVYHEPVRLLTTMVDEQNNGQPQLFDVVGPDDLAFVSYVIDVDRSDGRVCAELAWPSGHRPMETGFPRHEPRVSMRLPPVRKLALLTHVQPGSTLTTVRVYMKHWEIGKGDGRG